MSHYFVFISSWQPSEGSSGNSSSDEDEKPNNDGREDVHMEIDTSDRKFLLSLIFLFTHRKRHLARTPSLKVAAVL